MPTITTYPLTRAEAHWILTGLGRTDEAAHQMLDDMAADGIAWTSANLRDWDRKH